jgi:hypothetical protein
MSLQLRPSAMAHYVAYSGLVSPSDRPILPRTNESTPTTRVSTGAVFLNGRLVSLDLPPLRWLFSQARARVKPANLRSG